MKKKLLLILITIFNTYCYSQINFENGYYINNANEKIDCLIKNVDWNNNPIEFEYKLSKEGKSKKAYIKTIKEFGINGISKYIRSNVNIDRSSSDVNNLSKNKNPIFNEEQLFLKVLIEGKANLYQYNDINLKRFFFNKKDSNIEQLVYKPYVTLTGNYYRDNNYFRQQLFNSLKCPNFKSNRFKSIRYTKNQLIEIFLKYNDCYNLKSTHYEKKTKKDLFNLNVRPRLVNSSLSISGSSDLRNIDFGNKTNLSLGLEAEFILPFNKNKWAVIVEPTYQKFKTEKTNEISSTFGGELINKINYSSIELPVGIRYYVFLNNKSKIFINTSFITAFSFNSSVDYERNDDLTPLTPLDISTGSNIAFGLGYKYNDKFILEFRHQTERGLLSNNASIFADYNSFSIILGYTLF